MKNTWIVLLGLSFSTNGFAQKNNSLIKNITYYTASSAKWISILKTTNDSLLLFQKRGSFTKDEQHYKILGQEKRGTYFVIYVKKEPSVFAHKNPPPPAYIKPRASSFAAYTLFFSKDKERMFVATPSMFYKSIDEIKKVIAETNFANKYFTNWYPEATFNAFVKYPELTGADENTTQNVINYWINDLKQNKDKIRNTGNVPYQENLSKALIANHLSPLGTMTDLDQKITQYHIKVPQLKTQ